ncbi:MAG: DNA adenine methylase [Metamycoplasmataceae bacterium]
MNSRNKKDYLTKPFIKWAGGKRQLLNRIIPLLPKTFNNYIEPFIGGGALFFALQPQKAIINDINKELIVSYETIRDNYLELNKNLNKYQKKHSELFYYEKRKYQPKTNLNIATRFIYLNKAGFNGLYRVNAQGNFNVPFNKSEKVNLYEVKNIQNINKYLSNSQIKIFNKDFGNILKKAKANDFVFCDPPYDTDTKQFTSYNKTSFGKEEQLRLANYLKELNQKKVKWMLTNHDTSFIKNLYQDFNIKIISVNRSINSNGLKRKNSSNEVIITNYEIEAF